MPRSSRPPPLGKRFSEATPILFQAVHPGDKPIDLPHTRRRTFKRWIAENEVQHLHRIYTANGYATSATRGPVGGPVPLPHVERPKPSKRTVSRPAKPDRSETHPIRFSAVLVDRETGGVRSYVSERMYTVERAKKQVAYYRRMQHLGWRVTAVDTRLPPPLPPVKPSVA